MGTVVLRFASQDILTVGGFSDMLKRSGFFRCALF